MLKRQNAKDHMNSVRDICRRICAEENIITVLRRLKLLRVSARYIDFCLGLSSGTASEWMGNRRKVPHHHVQDLIRLEIRVHNDLLHYLEAQEGARLFKVPEIRMVKQRAELVRKLRLIDPAYRNMPESNVELGRDGKPVFGSPSQTL